MRRGVLLLIGALLFYLWSVPAWSEVKNLPIVIESQKLTYNDAKKVAVYLGNVIAQHGQTILKGDKLTIFFDKTGREIKKVIVEGNVSIKDPRGKGWCRKLIYYPYQEKVVLIGDAKLVQGKNILMGDRIIAYKSGKVEVIGQKKRVKTVIFPRESSGESGKRLKSP
jgi:lipopolysaccharide export system protein LptA